MEKVSAEIQISINDAAKYELMVVAEKVRVALTPYDIPNYAKASYDDVKKEFTISIHYLTDEEPRKSKELDGANGVRVFIGKRSGKLYRIILRNIERNEVPNVKVRVVGVMEQLQAEVNPDEKSTRKMNYNMLKDVLQTQELQELYAIPA